MMGGGLCAIQRNVLSHGGGLALEISLRVASQRQPAIERRVRPVDIQPTLKGARGLFQLSELKISRAEVAPAVHGKIVRALQQSDRLKHVAAREGCTPGALHQSRAPEEERRGMFEVRGRVERATSREGQVGASDVRVDREKNRGRDQSNHGKQNESPVKKRAHVAVIISVEWQYNCTYMGSLSSQIFSFMTNPQGGVVYHLTLILSIAFGLQSAFNHWRSSDFPQAQRTMVGLGILLSANLLLFAISLLGWQQVLNLNALLPSLDRAFVLLGLVWVIWLWAFPEPNNAADSAAALLSLLIASIAVLSLADKNALAEPSFNATVQDGLWQFTSIGLTLIGALILLIRRPSGWGNGIAFLTLAFLGHMVYLWSDRSTGDFPGAVRLAYLAAYPILLTLPQRFPAPSSQPISVKQEASVPERRRYSTDPKTFHALLDLAAETNTAKISQAVTRAIAQTMLADLCFLIYLTDNKTQLQIMAGYDLIREEPLEGSSLTKTAVPMLASAIQRGRPLRLPASGTSADIKGLGDVLGLGNPGNLMCVPMLTKEKESIGGVMLLSPYSNRLWSAEDQAFLSNIAASLVSIVQRGQQVTALQEKEQATQQSLEEALAKLIQTKTENEQLSRQLEESAKAPSPSSVDELIASHARIEELEKEIISLQTAKKPRGASEISQLEKELRITLEDTARLQNQLAEANMRILELEKREKSEHSNEQSEVVASISQELRQPMSSIIGYTDLLLGESVGILGALQRKFVERVKASTERIGSLIDDLIQVTTLESGLSDLKSEAVDLNVIIDNAMSYTSSQLREKNIAMRLDLPKVVAPVQADREALQQILIHLLQNAGAATPIEGNVTLKVQTRMQEEQAFIMIQVTDSGGGIPAEDLPRVFTRLYRADNVLIQGVGDTGVGLSIAKTLTEAQHGRIWVESDPGVGSTFSVLLPIERFSKAGER
jgi:signal transduction histidine kinase